MNLGLMQGSLPVPVSRGDPDVTGGCVHCTIKTPKSQVNGTVFKEKCLEKLTPVLAWVGFGLVFFCAGRFASRPGFCSQFFREQISWRRQARPVLLKRAATSTSFPFGWPLGVFAIAFLQTFDQIL